MNKYQVVLLMAGSGSRFDLTKNKALTKIAGEYLFMYSLKIFLQDTLCEKIILVVSDRDFEQVKEILKNIDNTKIDYVIGGKTRLASVQNGLKEVTNDVAVIHDVARPLINQNDVREIVNDIKNYDATTFYETCIDTYRLVDESKITPVDRNKLCKIVTPQAYKKTTFQTIIKADESNPKYTDEISILLEQNYIVNHLLISHKMPKLTTLEDYSYIEFLLNQNQIYKIGHSFDFHPFVSGDGITLGGVFLPFTKKLKGWSDADVLYHAITESIIGALGIGDIGKLYPDNDPKYYQIQSSFFLTDIKKRLAELGYEIANIDAIVYLEKPNLKNYKEQMEINIASLLEINKEKVNVKATTMEEKGLVGKGEGIGAESVVLIKLK